MSAFAKMILSQQKIVQWYRQQLSATKHAKLLLKTDQPAEYQVMHSTT